MLLRNNINFTILKQQAMFYTFKKNVNILKVVKEIYGFFNHLSLILTDGYVFCDFFYSSKILYKLFLVLGIAVD